MDRLHFAESLSIPFLEYFHLSLLHLKVIHRIDELLGTCALSEGAFGEYPSINLVYKLFSFQLPRVGKDYKVSEQPSYLSVLIPNLFIDQEDLVPW